MPGKILCVMGPTASGKTGLGVELALELGGEVVSGDSMQIYRGMDIGTAKPAPEETRGVPHHMIDVAGPTDSYSAARFVREATKCVDEILARGKLPIVVGGTGLYIDALVRGIDYAGAGPAGGTRRRLDAEWEASGPEAMAEKLRARDPESANKLHINDKKRILRALEVFEDTGVTISEHDRLSREAPPRYVAHTIALSFRERADLYGRIDRRVDLMLERGLLDEIRALLGAGVTEAHTSMQAIGYKELIPVVTRGCPLEPAVEEVKRASRRYAKRQLSWLRRMEGIHWIIWEKSPDYEFARQASTEFLEKIGIIGL